MRRWLAVPAAAGVVGASGLASFPEAATPLQAVSLGVAAVLAGAIAAPVLNEQQGTPMLEAGCAKKVADADTIVVTQGFLSVHSALRSLRWP